MDGDTPHQTLPERPSEPEPVYDAWDAVRQRLEDLCDRMLDIKIATRKDCEDCVGMGDMLDACEPLVREVEVEIRKRKARQQL
jgi:hypothetical protein